MTGHTHEYFDSSPRSSFQASEFKSLIAHMNVSREQGAFVNAFVAFVVNVGFVVNGFVVNGLVVNGFVDNFCEIVRFDLSTLHHTAPRRTTPHGTAPHHTTPH